MNRSHWRRPIAALVPILIALLAFGALPAMRLAAQGGPNPNTSNCEPNLTSTVMPDAFSLGQTAQVQLTMNMSCPDYKLPIDLVFLVDVSNSMTRGQVGVNDLKPTTEGGPGGSQPTAKSGTAPPPPIEPPIEPPADPLQADPLQADPSEAEPLQADPPVKTVEPPAPPVVPNPGAPRIGNGSGDPAGCEQPGGTNPGGTNPGGGGGSTLPTLPTVPAAKTPKTTAVPGGGIAPTKTPGTTAPPGGVNPGDQAAPAEPAGTEDLIREAKEFIRDFIEQPQIQQDLSNGTLRLGLASFNERGRRLMSLTSEGKRITGRLSLLRGGGRTRIDLGLRTAEAVLIERNNARRINNDADHTKVVIVISDGAFCARDLRVKVDKRIQVVTLAAGRGPHTKNMRTIASDLAYALKLAGGRAVKETITLYNKDFIKTRPVAVNALEMTTDVEPWMQIVDGTLNPAGNAAGQAIKWTSPVIDWTKPVTVTYDIRPQAGGLQNVNRWAQATWKDSEKRDGSGVFPALYVDVAGPTATATPEISATATPELR